MKVNEHNLLEQLKKLGYEATVQSETNQIVVIFKHDNRQFPLFIRTLHDGELLQLLTFIPCNIKPEQANDMARFLHIVNKELDVPGFCMDESSWTVFYRLLLPAPKKELADETFEAFLNTTQVVCKSFSPVIEAIAMGAMSLDEVLKKAGELKAESTK